MEFWLPVECKPGVTGKALFLHLQETLTMNTNDPDDIRVPDRVGVVFRKTLGHYNVHTDGRELDCTVSSLIHKDLI